MMEEFALCWNKLKFAENLSTGFQSLYDRGDFVDCTIAVDGQLLQCHKLVLAICSPYFREIFMNNPCRHPIIILKDVTYSIMSELLQFMYQGEVNVKQAELQSFMSIAESLQIKGLATNSNNNNSSNGSGMRGTDPINSSFSQFHHNNAGVQRNHHQHQFNSGGNHIENHRQTTSTPLSTASSLETHATAQATMKGKHISSNGGNGNNNGNGENCTGNTPPASSSSFSQKRSIDQMEGGRQSQMKMKRSIHDASDSDMNDSIDNMTHDDIFLPAAMQPQVTINESPRFDAPNVGSVNAAAVKREGSDGVAISRPQSPTALYRSTYNNSNAMQNSSYSTYYTDFSSNDLSINNSSGNNNNNGTIDMSKSHMDVPPGTPSITVSNASNLSNVTMLSATSLLHNSMIFNRNNTVATQQGMKTYWLCRSYRLTTCRARCITHQGQLISTTGQHNHPPHVKTSFPLSSSSLLSSNAKMDDNTNVQQTFAQPMSSNQIQAMPPPSSTMINQQQQQQQQMNANYGNNFSMSNILGAVNTLSDMDPHALLMHASNAAANIMSNIQITPIINTSIDDLLHNSSSTNPIDDDDDIAIVHDTNHLQHNIAISTVLPGERWYCGKLQFMLSQRGKPLLVHDGFSFGIQYIRKDKKYWQCNLSRKYNCKARVTTTDAGEIIVTNNEHCHTEIRQHLRKDYKMNKLQLQLSNQLNNHHHHHLANYAAIERKIAGNFASYMGQTALAAVAAVASSSASPLSTISTTQTSIMPSRQITTTTNSYPKNLTIRSPSITPEPPTNNHHLSHHDNDDDESIKRE